MGIDLPRGLWHLCSLALFSSSVALLDGLIRHAVCIETICPLESMADIGSYKETGDLVGFRSDELEVTIVNAGGFTEIESFRHFSCLVFVIDG